MGMEKVVAFPHTFPSWTAVRDLLAARELNFQVCMIDGQLSFPDELPPETWNELRFRTPQGMVTARREANRIAFVTWGNATPEMQAYWNSLVTAFAEAGGGIVG